MTELSLQVGNTDWVVSCRLKGPYRTVCSRRISDALAFIRRGSGNCSVAIELVRYAEWFLTSIQAETDALNHHMMPVSPMVVRRIQTNVFERMTCEGKPLMDLVRQQKYEEEESLKTWKLPVSIVTPFIFIIILVLVIYAIRQRVQYVRMLDRDDWKINFFEIDFVVPRSRRRTGNNAAEAEEIQTPSSGNFLGRWNIHEVVTRPLSIAKVFYVNRRVKRALMSMREEVGHENIARFFGISFLNEAIYLVEQHCANGTLIDFLRDNKYGTSQSFRYVICADIANGMAYLHRQNLIHGNLSINKCHVDSRWTIKIVEWEYPAMYDVVCRTERNQTQAEKGILHFLCSETQESGSTFSRAFRHLAPELQKDGRLYEPTRAGDVFSFGIIIQDLFINSPRQELHEIDKMPVKARQIMELACHENTIKRPTFEQLEKSIRSAISGGGQKNLLDRCVHQEKLFVRHWTIAVAYHCWIVNVYSDIYRIF